MEPATDLESFLHWSQNADAEFPDLQYPLEQQEEAFWNELLDQYTDPSYLAIEQHTTGEDLVPTVEDLPELTPAPTSDESDTHGIHQSLSELQSRVGSLEDMIAQKERSIDALESYIAKLQPYLIQLSNSILDMQTKGAM